MYLILVILLSLGSGVSLGLTGGGGSILTVPLLVYIAGVDAHQAVSMSLVIVGTASLVAAILHAGRGSVDFRVGGLFAAGGAAGALVGSRLTYLVSSEGLLLIFACILLLAAYQMMKKRPTPDGLAQHCGALKAMGIGAAVGVLTGFLGIGGGFIIVPALTILAGLPIKASIGTSLMVIAANSVAGTLGHLGQAQFDASLTTLVTACAVAGTLVGAALSTRVSSRNLRRVFALLAAGVAIFLVAKNVWILG